jgi:hypothetical protein
MPYVPKKKLEFQVSQSANSDTCPRPTQVAAESDRWGGGRRLVRLVFETTTIGEPWSAADKALWQRQARATAHPSHWMQPFNLPFGVTVYPSACGTAVYPPAGRSRSSSTGATTASSSRCVPVELVVKYLACGHAQPGATLSF